jgi:hypothetical protein
MLILGIKEGGGLAIFDGMKFIGTIKLHEAEHGRNRWAIEGDDLRVVRTEVLKREAKERMATVPAEG